MSDFVDFLPLFSETPDTIRQRINDDANAGLDPTDSRYVDVREGSFFFDVTQVLLVEIARVWDALATEVPASAFPVYAWGEYLDDHASLFGLVRKPAPAAEGTVIFLGLPGTLVAVGTEVAADSVDPDSEPPTFEVLDDGTIPAPVTTPGVPTATPSTTGGTLADATYSYVVTATDGYGETDPSAAVVTTITGSGGTGSIALDWGNVPGAVAYRLYRLQGAEYDRVVEVTSSSFNDMGSPAPDSTKNPPVANTTGGAVRVPVRATDSGAEGNVGVGAVTNITSSVAGLTGAINDQPMLGGADPETDEDLRDRLLAVYGGTGGGNINDYRRWALAYPGVGQVSVVPAALGPGTVQVAVMDANGRPVAASVVTGLQTYLDPVPGTGAGQAPIGASVTVSTVTLVNIAIVSTVQFKAGYSLDGIGGTVALRAAIETALSTYLNALDVGEDVIFDHVRAQFYAVTGVLKVAALTVQGGASDVAIATFPPQSAALGSVTLYQG